jgi:hypothetical protein
MQSPSVLDQVHSHTRETALIPVVDASRPNPGVDWRETCWFLKREEDDLAGYLFAQDYELREGSD